jgi:hypothetical protein
MTSLGDIGVSKAGKKISAARLKVLREAIAALQSLVDEMRVDEVHEVHRFAASRGDADDLALGLRLLLLLHVAVFFRRATPLAFPAFRASALRCSGVS